MTKKTKPALAWTENAKTDLLGLIGNIAEKNPRAAQALQDEIVKKIGALPDHPHLYAESLRAPGFRQLTVRSNFLVYYTLDDDAAPTSIAIAAVIHARQDRLPG
ncbi:MAG: hypothetical protein NVS1B6_13550 [Steroidobacteraceae bacterium]